MVASEENDLLPLDSSDASAVAEGDGVTVYDDTDAVAEGVSYDAVPLDPPTSTRLEYPVGERRQPEIGQQPTSDPSGVETHFWPRPQAIPLMQQVEPAG